MSDATDVSQPWDQDNQAWWDWYVSLAQNDNADDALIASAPLPDVAIPTDEEVMNQTGFTGEQKARKVSYG